MGCVNPVLWRQQLGRRWRALSRWAYSLHKKRSGMGTRFCCVVNQRFTTEVWCTHCCIQLAHYQTRHQDSPLILTQIPNSIAVVTRTLQSFLEMEFLRSTLANKCDAVHRHWAMIKIKFKLEIERERTLGWYRFRWDQDKNRWEIEKREIEDWVL